MGKWEQIIKFSREPPSTSWSPCIPWSFYIQTICNFSPLLLEHHVLGHLCRDDECYLFYILVVLFLKGQEHSLSVFIYRFLPPCFKGLQNLWFGRVGVLRNFFLLLFVLRLLLRPLFLLLLWDFFHFLVYIFSGLQIECSEFNAIPFFPQIPLAVGVYFNALLLHDHQLLHI
jgi:hypothetical protein